MKKVFTILALLCISVMGFSQQDSTMQKKDSVHSHRARWERMMEKHMKMMDSAEWSGKYPAWPMPPHHWGNNHAKPSNLSTNWLIVDLGFTNYTDKTNYAGTTAQTFAPGSNSNWFNLKNNKSVDVNIWLFMQRLNVVKHVVNLKYGLGIELNNYRYEDNVKFLTNPSTQATTVIQDTISFSKNKLAADYVTVPFMINFNFTPQLREGFGISVGISAGYLYSSRQKTISSQFGKQKTFDDFDLNPWKFSWIAEAQLGPVILYGSLATKSMFNSQGLDQIPYTFGIRLSKW
jgi:Outer membrane protein beta-barrel domain